MSQLKIMQWYVVVMLLFMASCTDVDITMPKGPKGDTGLSAYEFWMEKVADGTIDWPKDQTGVADFFKYLKGKDGNDGKDGQSAFEQWKDMIVDGSVDDPHNPGNKWPAGNNTVQDFWRFLTGASGENGQVPHIGDNGHWFIGNEDTGVSARGRDGKDGSDGRDAVPPTVTIGDNGNWFVNGVDTGKKAVGQDGKDGKDGTSVTIGENGNWIIDGVDTGKKAEGKDGKSPEVVIGANGNWYIDGKDTRKPAFGKDGTNGTNGKSAYELWKEYISSGNVDNPHNPDQKWPADRNKQTDFWDFLTGKSSVIEIEVGKYNVIPEYWNSSLKEYVIPSDGSVLYTVYDKAGKKVTAGVTVSGLPGVSSTETFTTNAEGQFKVAWNQLPDMVELSKRKGSVSVTVNGVQETSAGNTLVPNRVNVRATITSAYLYYYSNTNIDDYKVLRITYSFERQVDGEWGKYPTLITTPYYSMASAKVKNINQPVNEENLDKDKFIFSYRANNLMEICRPIVLTEMEKANVAKNDTVQKLMKNEWDKTDGYVALYFGDGAGTYNDYGQTIYLQDKIHVPEVYPAPSFKENGVFVEIKQGITSLWGEIDTDNLTDFYKTYSYPSRESRFEKEEGTNIWKHPAGKLPASELADNRAVFIEMRTFINGTGGTVHTGTKPLSEGGKRFKLASAYPNNWIGLDIRSRTESKDKVTYSLSYEYRGRYAYYLIKEGDNYFLVDFADRSKKMSLEIKDCPDNWMN